VAFLHSLRDRKSGRADVVLNTMNRGLFSVCTSPCKDGCNKSGVKLGVTVRSQTPSPAVFPEACFPSLMHPFGYHPAVYWSYFTIQWGQLHRETFCVCHESAEIIKFNKDVCLRKT